MAAEKAQIEKRVTRHPLHHSFATNLFASGNAIRNLYDILEQKSFAQRKSIHTNM